MKSNPSNTFSWQNSIHSLFRGNSTKTSLKLESAGIKTVNDLLWTLPRKVISIPPIRDFSFIQENEYFRAMAKIINVSSRPSFRGKGRGRVPLLNINAIVQCEQTQQNFTLTWFNTYPTVVKKLKGLDHMEFFGEVVNYKDKLQIINPEFAQPGEIDQAEIKKFRVIYPATNTVTSPQIQKTIDKIPTTSWDLIEENLPPQLIEKYNFWPRSKVFQILHAKKDWNIENAKKALYQLKYEELFHEQVMISARRKFLKRPKSPSFQLQNIDPFKKLFPYELTIDQEKTLEQIKADLTKTEPMMRLVQGDVGCGKTTVAIISALIVLKDSHQVALMCPTESLARQHFKEISKLFSKLPYKVELLLGSTKAKDKKEILKNLAEGTTQFIIGTHSLFQEAVQYKNLALAIIDEQHKFGVEQRLKLVAKGEGTHCLIMTATPIPRSLSLTQYGDLDLSIIKSIPKGRKGHKTKIVTEKNYDQFLSFLKTRLSMNEQAYVVAPAIEESEKLDLINVNEIFEKFSKYFPEYRIACLHGKLSSKEKEDVFNKFSNKEIDLLISTSVIEVGINVTNATIMAIMSPERFGLSSLHQLRGRVGRGEKPGFCFLVCEKSVSQESLERLKVIENHTDGFIIAEEDLRIRGEGNLFGKVQSGSTLDRKVANIVTDMELVITAKYDIEDLIEQKNTEILKLLDYYSEQEIIFATI